MSDWTSQSPHTFHIPVMGTGFTVDTPLRVARYGISSVISLVDDLLIEQMRKFHSEQTGEPFEPIGNNDENARARRITAYLNLLDRLVQQQVHQLQASPFEPGSEITRYFSLLPNSGLKSLYDEMLETQDPAEKEWMQSRLRQLAVPGTIDVNIMSKVDRDLYRDGEKLPPELSDASAALRGYAKSTLRSSIVFSAGMNPRLYSYTAQFDDFFPDAQGELRKKIVLKVSDYRSAVIQGKFLAKRGLWVSEFRIESGLNCGGHAFPTKGFLLGPILAEFKDKKEQLTQQLHAVYIKALASLGRQPIELPLELRITAQGGIGTAAEDQFLLDYYQMDGTGWATPFLLVPEVTNVDEAHLKKLTNVQDGDVYLSDSSPFGLPFWNLRTSASEESRRQRIAAGKPGSPCTKGIVKLHNTEFTEVPICVASRTYQKLKLQALAEGSHSAGQLPVLQETVLAKSCICNDLAGGALIKNGIDPQATPAICPGPNLVNFSRLASLEEMVDHIYGRLSLLSNPDRPPMFTRELDLYVEYLGSLKKSMSLGLCASTPEYVQEFEENLLEGIEYYRRMADQLDEPERERFLAEIDSLSQKLGTVSLATAGPEAGS